MQADSSALLRRNVNLAMGTALAVAAAATFAMAAAPVKRAPATAVQAPRPASARKVAPRPAPAAAGSIPLSGPWAKEYRLKAGETVEVSVHLDRPTALPPNGRVGVEWTLARP